MIDKEVKSCTIANQYPTYRDKFLKSAYSWLVEKKKQDNAERFWRVHDKIYDLKTFAALHPGGNQWIQITKGTDITDLFETHHYTPKARKLLQKYYLKDAEKPRNMKLTYLEDGFFKTLQKRGALVLSDLDTKPIRWTKFYTDLMLILMFIAAIFAARNNDPYLAVFLAMVSGVIMMWLTMLAHNFIHQKDNWRMYLMNFSLMGWRDWRVFHAMSHHMYPNSYHDLLVTMFEPWVKWIPEKKTSTQKYFYFFISPFLYAELFFLTFLLRMVAIWTSKLRVLYWDEIIPITLPLAMYLGSIDVLMDQPLWIILSKIPVLYVIHNAFASFLYAIISINDGHHHSESVHEGDELKSLDFGIFQLGATLERKEANGYLFISLTHFGDHSLHHMFPTVDHALLPHLRDALLETCKEFNLELRQYHWYQMIIPQFKQLARSETIGLI